MCHNAVPVTKDAPFLSQKVNQKH